MAETVFPWFLVESMGFGWVLRTWLLTEFVGAVNGLDLCLDVILHELLYNGGALIC